MKKTKITDFLLCMSALIVCATIALLAALKKIEAGTAIAFGAKRGLYCNGGYRL